MMAKEPLGLRIDAVLMARLRGAAKAGLYAPSMTQIVERGIELALKELEKKVKK